MSEVNEVLEKVRKLVALAYGGATEAEAETALQRAQAILARHNLSMDDVVEHSEAQTRDELDEVTQEDATARYNERWRRVCMMAVAELYFCKYLYANVTLRGKNTSRPQRGVKHMFVGKAHNAAVARLMGEYLVQTVTRLAHDGAREYYGRGMTSAERNKFFRNFSLGCAERLYARARELRRQAEAGEAVDTGGRNLPALRGVYEHELSLAEQYIEENFGRTRTVRSRASVTDANAFNRGQTAGDSISLSAQVGSQRKRQIGGQR